MNFESTKKKKTKKRNVPVEKPKDPWKIWMQEMEEEEKLFLAEEEEREKRNRVNYNVVKAKDYIRLLYKYANEIQRKSGKEVITQLEDQLNNSLIDFDDELEDLEMIAGEFSNLYSKKIDLKDVVYGLLKSITSRKGIPVFLHKLFNFPRDIPF